MGNRKKDEERTLQRDLNEAFKEAIEESRD